MRFAFNDDQRLLQQGVREYLEGECTPEAVRAAWEGERGGLWKGLGGLGVLGLLLPEAAGGLGMDLRDAVLVLEEAGRAALPEPLLDAAIVAAPLLAEVGADLDGLAGGERVAVLGIEGDRHIAHADRADVLLIQREGRLHLLGRDAVSLTEQPTVDPGRPVFSVAWDAGDATVIDTPNDLAYLRAVDRGILGAAAMQVGAASRMIELATDYAKVREQFGKPIGSFQAVKHHLASAFVKVEFAKPVVYRAAHSLAVDAQTVTRDVSMAKVMATQAAALTAKACLQVHGAIGYTWEHDLQLWMKQAWGLGTAYGTEDQHRHRVAEAILP